MASIASSIDQDLIVEPRWFGSFKYCPLCASSSGVEITTIYLEGHNDTGAHACTNHYEIIKNSILRYETIFCIFNLSSIITTDLDVRRSSGILQAGWCLRKCLMYDGIGVTYLDKSTDTILIRVAKYNNRIIECCKDMKLKDLLNDNEIDPLTLDLPQSILDKLDVKTSYLKFVD